MSVLVTDLYMPRLENGHPLSLAPERKVRLTPVDMPALKSIITAADGRTRNQASM